MKAKFLKGRAEDRAKYIKEGYKVTDRRSGCYSLYKIKEWW